MSRLASLFVAMLCVVHVSDAFGGVLVLKNGDRISGEIKQIWDAEVAIEPSYADEFLVEMGVIKYIESDREFEIELSDGREIVARPVGGDENGQQLLLVDGEQIAVPVAALYEMEEIEEYFDWESFIDWGATLNTGNTDSRNTRLSIRSNLRLGDHRHIGELTISREEQREVSTKEQDLLQYNYNWLFSEPWFLNAAYSFERDPIRDLQKRMTFIAGLGRDFWDTPRVTLNATIGGGYVVEEIGGVSTDSSAVSWALRYRQDLFDEDLELFHNQTIIHYVSGRDNTVYKTTTGLKYEISDLLYSNVTLNYDYETQPAQGALNEDISLIFGLGLEF